MDGSNEATFLTAKPFSMKPSSETGIDHDDIVGSLHMHTTTSDGADSLADMARGAYARGCAYM
jgi:hypothetical protein